MAHAVPHPRQATQARRQWEIGQAHARAERWDEALAAHRSATRLAPHDAVYALNHARALLARNELERAAAEALRALRLDPALLAARDLAVEAMMREQRSAAVVEMLRSLAPASRRDQAFHLALGVALRRQGLPREAVSALFDGLSLGPGHAHLHYNLGFCFFDLNMKEEAAQCFGTALLLGAGEYALSARGWACFAARETCQWHDHDVQMAALAAAARQAPGTGGQLPSAAFAHLAFSADRGEQLAAAAHAARFATSRIRPLSPPADDWQPGARRLRIGYVSGDFHAHATAFLMAGMLEAHDRSAIEVHLYSHGPDDHSPMRRRVEAAAEAFVDVQAMSDAEVAQRIRADGIDLLVDLKGHTSKNRFSIFAYRAAPLQLSFLGYPGTTGAACIDYVIGDPTVTPLAHAADYTEAIAQLPRCYQPNDARRHRPGPAARAEHGLPAQALVLCCFNQPYKISPEVWDSWCRLLHRLPEAVLWLLEWNPQALGNLRREAVARGIDPARLIAAPQVAPDAHIDRVALADLFIDTWPYNAHTTASDALWAGVPVVSFCGTTFASRVGASLLQAVGMPELACPDLATYEDTVCGLAADRPRREALRARLVAARDTAPLFDTPGFTRDIEALFLRIAGRRAQGLPPGHLPACA